MAAAAPAPIGNQADPLLPVLAPVNPELDPVVIPADAAIYQSIYNLFATTRSHLPCISSPMPDSLIIAQNPIPGLRDQHNVVIIPNITVETNLQNYTPEQKRELVNNLRGQILNKEQQSLDGSLGIWGCGALTGAIFTALIFVTTLSFPVLSTYSAIGISTAGGVTITGIPLGIMIHRTCQVANVASLQEEALGFSTRQSEQIWDEALLGAGYGSNDDSVNSSASSEGEFDIDFEIQD